MGKDPWAHCTYPPSAARTLKSRRRPKNWVYHDLETNADFTETMSSIHLQLQPLSLDSCNPSTLRERRRSSIRPRALFPRLFQGPSTNNHGRDGESAIDDDIHESNVEATQHGHLPVQYPSPLVNVHLSGYSTNAEPTRHQDTLPRLHYTSEPQTPSQTSPTASSKNSIVDIPPVVPVSPPERLAIRLAAGYFMYFMCGWGDGGKIFSDLTIYV